MAYKLRLLSLLILVFFVSACTQTIDEPEVERIALSLEHQAYLESINHTVSMCVDPDWMPFEHYKNGEFTGIAADLVYLVAKRLGITFEIVETENWTESEETSKGNIEGKFCKVLPFTGQNPRRDEWLMFTEPLFIDPNVFVTRQEFVTSDGNSNIIDPSLLENKTLVMPAGSGIGFRFETEFPNVSVMWVESERDVFEAIDSREADFTLRSRMIAFYVIRQEGYFNLRTAGDLAGYENYLRMAIVKDEVMLRDILNLGVQTITDEERQDVINKYVFFVIEEPINYTLLIVIATTFLVVLATILIMGSRLKKSNQARLKVLEGMTALVWYIRADYSVAFMNSAAKTFLGQERLSTFRSLTLSSVYEPLLTCVEQAKETGEAVQTEIDLFDVDGALRTFSVNITPELTSKGVFRHAICIADDVTPLRKLLKKTDDLNRFLADTIEYLPDPTFVVDKAGRITHWNRAIELITGHASETMIGSDYLVYSNAVYGYETKLLVNYLLDQEPIPTDRYQKIEGYKDRAYMETSLLLNQKERIVEAVAVLVKDEHGNIVGAVESFRDVTEIKQREQTIVYLSQHDPLTKLLNRTYFEQVKARFNEPSVYPLSVISADLNNLKAINDTHGHAMGDRALIVFAGLFQQSEQKDDIVARLGGDEFVLVMPSTDAATAKKRLQHIKDSLSQTTIDGTAIHVALGLATAETMSKATFEVLLKDAEDRMYEDKTTYKETLSRHLKET